MLRRPTSVLCAALLAAGAGGCSWRRTHPPDAHRVDEAAITRELNREVPGSAGNPALRVQVLDVADLCRSSAGDFKFHARSVATADLQRQLRRQIRAGCPWRSAEVDDLLARQNR